MDRDGGRRRTRHGSDTATAHPKDGIKPADQRTARLLRRRALRKEQLENPRGVPREPEEPQSLLQRAVLVLQGSYLDSSSQEGFQYSQAVLVENDVFLSELPKSGIVPVELDEKRALSSFVELPFQAFARAKKAAGYSREELEETFGFLLFDKEEEARKVCQTGLRVNSSSISTLGDPAKGVYISKHADCLHPRPWYHGKSGYIVICKLIKGKVRVIPEDYSTTYTCPSPGYDCHVAESLSHTSPTPSPCQAFEQSQYYMYEVSGGSPAKRPRQVCPYILLCCHYRDPKGVPGVAVENLPERGDEALYCPWRGQLSIQGQLVGSIALRTPYSSSIPAQLPPNLDINHVMGLSDLRKKLPEAAFGKRNYTGSEVCFQGFYSSLYEVEISSKEQHRMDQLVENLKKKDLAVLRYLRDHGVLILLSSSALARDEGFDAKEPVSLLALFLFTSPQALSPRVEKGPPKDTKKHGGFRDTSLKITSVLPGLQYALRKASSSPWGDVVSPSTRIRQHLQEYARLEQGTEPSDSGTALPSAPSLSEEQPNPFQKSPGQSLPQLQCYLSNPSSYTLAMSAAMGCLSGAGQALARSLQAQEVDPPLAVPPDPEKTTQSDAPNGQAEEGPPEDASPPSNPWGEQGRRKSSRLLMSKKNLSPDPVQEHPVEEESRSREAAKKKSSSTSSSKKQESTASSKEPMLKLANLQFPHSRKRGAEVLSAEIVHKAPSEPVEKEPPAPDGPAVEAKRAKTLESPDLPAPAEVPSAESVLHPVERSMDTEMESSPPEAQDQTQAESGLEQPVPALPAEVPPECQGTESHGDEVYPVGMDGVEFSCDSHGLNLLADLALGSCVSLSIPKDSEETTVSDSPPCVSPLQQEPPPPPPKPRSLRSAPDHRPLRHGRRGASAGKAAEKPGSGNSSAAPREKNPGSGSHNSTNPTLPPGEEPSRNSAVSTEHSYASSVAEPSRKHPSPKGAAASKTSSRGIRKGRLVGKVLPFRHQQSESPPQQPSGGTRGKGGLRCSARVREDFGRWHAVTASGSSVKVTRRWEGQYLFSLDTRYTNNSLEKAVIRALHGPWNCDFPDDVEEMKLILHMWVALFYRKPTKLLSSNRKVVEHRNPKKYVLINSTEGFLSDDGDESCGLETCPADSRSDPDQTPSSSQDPSAPSQGSALLEKSPADSQSDAHGTPGGDSTVSSSSGELPSEEEEEEEPSSTSCPESLPQGIPMPEPAEESLVVMDGQVEMAEECVWDVPSVGAEELLEATTTPSPSHDLRCASESPSVLGLENSSSPAPNSSPAPWTGTPCGIPGDGKQQESGWAAAAAAAAEDGPGSPKGMESTGDAGHCMELGDSSQATSDPQGAVPLEASPGSANPARAPEEGLESQELLGDPVEEEGEVEEGKEEDEDLEEESAFLGPVDLVLSESSDTEVGSEHSEQKPENAGNPEDSAVPGGGPAPSPTSWASSCSGRSTPGLADGTATGTGSLGLPGEVQPEPWEAPATPNPQADGVGVASPAEGGPPRDSGEMQFPPDPGVSHGAQPDSITGSSGAAGETFGNSLEQKGRDHEPSAEGGSQEMQIPPDPGVSHGAQPDSITGSSGAAGETFGNSLEHDRDPEPSAERWEPPDGGSQEMQIPPDPGVSHGAQPDTVTGSSESAGETLGNDLEQKDRDPEPSAEGESQEMQMPPDPGVSHGAQPDTVTGSSESAGETLGNGLEQKDRDPEPSAERWEPPDGASREMQIPPDPGVSHGAQPDTVTGSSESIGETFGNSLEQKDRDPEPSAEGESQEMQMPPDPGVSHGAQPDTATGSSESIGETFGNSLEHDRDPEPSAERWEPAGNTPSLESPQGQAPTVALSPDSSSACLTSPDGSLDPGAAPGGQESMAGIPSPSQDPISHGGSSCLSQEPGEDVCAALPSTSFGKADQAGNEVLGEELPGSPGARGTGVLDDPMGAGDGQDFTRDYTALGDDPKARQGGDVCPGAENSPRSHPRDREMVDDAPQQPERPLHQPLESEPCSLGQEGLSATEEPPRQQQSSPNSPGDSAPGQDRGAPSSTGQRQWGPGLWQPRDSHGEAEGSVAAWIPRHESHPPEGVIRYRAQLAHSCPVEVLPGGPGARSPPPPPPQGLHGTEPSSVLVLLPSRDPAPDNASWSCSPRASPGSQARDPGEGQRQEPILPEGLGGESSIPVSRPPSSPEGELLVPWDEPRSVSRDRESKMFPGPYSASRDMESEEFPDPHSTSRDMESEEFPDPHSASRDMESEEFPDPHSASRDMESEEFPDPHSASRDMESEEFPDPHSASRDMESEEFPDPHSASRDMESEEFPDPHSASRDMESEEFPDPHSASRDMESEAFPGPHSASRDMESEAFPGPHFDSRDMESEAFPGPHFDSRDMESEAFPGPHFDSRDMESEAFPDPYFDSRDREFEEFPDPYFDSRDMEFEEFPDPRSASKDMEFEEFPDPYFDSRDMEFEEFPDPHCDSREAEEGEIPFGEGLEFSEAEDPWDAFPRAEQLPSTDTHMGLTFEDPLDIPSSDSEQEHFWRNPPSPLPPRRSYGTRSTAPAGTRTNHTDSSLEGHGEGWGQGLSRHSRSSVATRRCRERVGNPRPPGRRSSHTRQSHLLRSLTGSWRGLEEITQHTLDMECLRFHYKLNQILRDGKPALCTSESIFPKHPSRRCPRSRSPLQVTIPPSDTRPGDSSRHRRSGRHAQEEDTPWDTRRRPQSQPRPQSRAPSQPGRLRQERPPGSCRDVAVILDKDSQSRRVVVGEGGLGEPGNGGGTGTARPGRTVAFGDMIGELCGALRGHLHRVATGTAGRPGMFYLVETGKEPFFERLKALLRKEGWVRMEPLSFCRGRRHHSDRLLVIIRNEDISSHIHSVPGLLELKHCPNVVFAGVDSPEDIPGHTFQELFHTGGFLVSDHTVLESVPLAQLEQLVKVLEKLNRSGRWKWLLHYRESRKLRGDLRRAPEAVGKQRVLRWCQGLDLVELLPFHGCDSARGSERHRLHCLLGLQVQHVGARLAVFITENPGASRDILESKGILVVDVNTFLGTVQDLAAPFRRSYW